MIIKAGESGMFAKVDMNGNVLEFLVDTAQR
jgi:hypothetical protein